MHQRYLVTGGAGFIGSHLVDQLLAQGAEVLCVDSFHDYYDPARKRQNVASHLANKRYRLIEADIRDGDKMRSTVADFSPDVIVHLAARAGVRASMTDPLVYQEVNIRGTMNMLEAARHAGVERFVNSSSSSVYGENRTVPFRESDALLLPASPYGAAKLGAESMVQVYGRQFGLKASSLRFFTVYGPRQRPDMAIAKFSALMRRGDPIEIYGDGSSRRDFTFVADIVKGILAASELDRPGHEVFNIGCSSPVLLRELVAELERALGVKASISHQPNQPGDVPQTHSDISKARSLLGYEPQVGLPEGLDRFVESLGS